MPEYTLEQALEINASREEVFSLVADFEKRSYLGPFWVVVGVEKLTDGPVRVGTVFRHRVRRDDMKMESDYTSEIVTFSPNFQLAYKISTKHNLKVTWTVTAIDENVTQVEYNERVVLGEEDGDHEQVLKFMEGYAREWLVAIKHYVQLKDTGLQGLFKRLVDRFLLKMPPHQRRMVIMLLAFKLFMATSFLVIALIFVLYRLIQVMVPV